MSIGTGSKEYVPDIDAKLLIDLAEAEDQGLLEKVEYEPRHRAIYAITLRVLQSLFTEGNHQAFYVNLGIPEDAIVNDVRFNPIFDCFELKVEHPSFPIVAQGAELDYRRIETTIWRWKE